jgi:hypothetical protein
MTDQTHEPLTPETPLPGRQCLSAEDRRRLRGLLDRMLGRFARVAGRSIRLKEENAELRKARDGMETACNICYDVMAQRAKESAELQASLSRLREENAALRGEGKP